MINLLGVRVDYPFKKDNFNKYLDRFLIEETPSYIFTVNPEFIYDSYYDKSFKDILNSSKLNLVDGTGVLLASWVVKNLPKDHNKFLGLGKALKEFYLGNLSNSRFTGVDATLRILDYANNHSCSVLLLGGDPKEGVSEELSKMISKEYKNIRHIKGISKFSWKESDDESTLKTINVWMRSQNLSKIDFVLVAYGHSKQEKWIARNSAFLPGKVFIGVGGTFDYMTGKVRRAPNLFQKLGLEWLFRLTQNPSYRFKRVLKATFGFLYIFLFNNTRH